MAYTIGMKPDELKEWRYKNGYSQKGLASRLGVDVMTISRWERGVREIPSFLHLALAYLELKGVEMNKTIERKNKRKGGK